MQAISVYSPNWDPADSYGILARRLSRELAGAGLHVNRMGLGEALGPIMPSPGGILLGYPTMYDDFGLLARMGRRVAVTMFESTILPEGWVEVLNKCHAVVAPSRWVEQTFRENGVTAPIVMVPLGLDEVFRPVKRERKTPTIDHPFRFLALGDRHRRKGWDLAGQAFVRAFGDDPRYRLIIKARKDAWKRLDLRNQNIKIWRLDLDAFGMAALYQMMDCMVFPTRGEGFGWPPREFAATGGPAICTDWGGTADDIDRWGYALPYGLGPAWSGMAQFAEVCGEWAEPDVQALADLMCMAAALPDPDRGLEAATAVRELYRWDRFAQIIMQLWRGDAHGNSYTALAAAQ